jgi:aspartyl-tRNA(Asn)/glutamyl-tRNA(Gln) amidotransferase subunit A
VLEAARARIAALNPSLNAFLSLSDQALADARAVDDCARRGVAGPLAGVPVAIKDLLLGRDAPATAGSKIYGAGLASRRDATVIRRLRKAGAVIVGRTNLHEIALGVTNENEHFGPARNPWDRARVPGGSSGGSAVAVAAGLVPAAIGSDTRGSIRIPAAACGVTGLKPSYGLVPTAGVIPLAWSLDHVGPITRSADDAALLLGALVSRGGQRYADALGRGAHNLRVGVCQFLMRDLDGEIQRAVQDAIGVLARCGAVISDVTVPELDGTAEASGVIVLAEAAAHYEPYLRANPGGLGRAVRERLEGAFRLSAVDLARARQKDIELRRAMAAAFRRVDVLAGATLPALPPRIGEGVVRDGSGEVPVLAAFPRLTAAWNLAGLPALSLPCGFSAGGLPIGLQLVAGGGRETTLFQAAGAYQRETEWHRRSPALD